jgi:hypothetical protein
MPFTPAHTLAVIPLARVRALTPSALAIGSMIPDLWAFMPGAPSYSTSHSWVWGAITGVCYGLAAFVLFRICRGPAIAFAPEQARRKLAPYVAHDLSMGVRGWASVVISLVLGVWTHVLWDSFTHAHGLGTVWFPQLMTEWLSVWGRPWRGHKVLQLGSAAIGLPILAWLIARWYARLPAAGLAIEPASSKLRVLGITLFVCAPIAVLCMSWGVDLAEPQAFEFFVRHVVTRTISLYALGLGALTLAAHQRQRMD